MEWTKGGLFGGVDECDRQSEGRRQSIKPLFLDVLFFAIVRRTESNKHLFEEKTAFGHHRESDISLVDDNVEI